MATKHFFKILTIFTGMIALGLIVLFVVDYFDEQAAQARDAKNQIQVAK